MATRLGLPSAPAEAEALAVARDLALAELTGARLHLRQVTTAAALDLVRAAKARGVAVTAGVTPAHFMLSDLALGGLPHVRPALAAAARGGRPPGGARRASPTARSTWSPRATTRAAPRTSACRSPTPSRAWPGPRRCSRMVLTLVRDGVIGIERAFDLVARNPARLLGVEAGELRAGAEADIALVDPEKPWVVDLARMAASAGNTPFDRPARAGPGRRAVEGRRGGRPLRAPPLAAGGASDRPALLDPAPLVLGDDLRVERPDLPVPVAHADDPAPERGRQDQQPQILQGRRPARKRPTTAARRPPGRRPFRPVMFQGFGLPTCGSQNGLLSIVAERTDIRNESSIDDRPNENPSR